MLNDLKKKAVLITGGTRGIGLATGLAFARQGATVWLTYKWGSADENEILTLFQEAGATPPRIVRADAGSKEDTLELISQMRAEHERVEAFISNASVALVIKQLEDYEERSLYQSIHYSAWPMYAITREIQKAFGAYPRYVVGLSSGGPDAFYQNYDFVAASKAVMETLCRYMNRRLYDEDVRINVIRSRLVSTESLRDTFGQDIEKFAERYNLRREFISCEEVANSVLALCSGLMDGVSGQVIMVDRGTSFFDSMLRLYYEGDVLGRADSDLDRKDTQ